jgi:hypothetical protein
MAYPVPMETLPALLHEVWERTPPEAQASIRALAARVETLTSMGHALQEQGGTLQEQLSLSRLNHRRPRGQAHPEVMQGTTEFHHQIADTFFP